MKCPECVVQGQRSKVYSLGAYTSCNGGGEGEFWDEDGVPHEHAPSTETTHFHCSRGHRWATKNQPPCPARGCTYGNKTPVEETT